ncbi:uncharacterized protein [Diadema setosum]|uniref:uncharacterized protein n=1 Tax=Diadema setosum TaxID=31175 RepID=UPI003B3B74DD
MYTESPRKKAMLSLLHLTILDELEEEYLPGNVQFQLSGVAEVFHHTPVKKGQSTEYGQFAFEPLDVGASFDEALEIPAPNFKAVAWPYPNALAKTLEELDEEISDGIVKHGLDPKEDHLILTTIKDGADGMGDISISKEATERMLPDKAFRAAFTIVQCQIELEGKLLSVYEPEAPNSIFVTRPLLEGDENNKASAREMLEEIQTDMQKLKDTEKERVLARVRTQSPQTQCNERNSLEPPSHQLQPSSHRPPPSSHRPPPSSHRPPPSSHRPPPSSHRPPPSSNQPPSSSHRSPSSSHRSPSSSHQPRSWLH